MSAMETNNNTNNTTNNDETNNNETVVIANPLQIRPCDYKQVVEAKSHGVILSSGHLFLHVDPAFTALYNQQNIYKDKNLKLVCGSLGLGLGGEIWFEYGRYDWTTYEQFKSDKSNGRVDAWFWLVDPKTKHIYDMVSPYAPMFAIKHNQQIAKVFSDQVATPIEDVSLRKCTQYGLHYIEASEEVQKQIIQDYRKYFERFVSELGISFENI
jgi:hypothetical protein